MDLGFKQPSSWVGFTFRVMRSRVGRSGGSCGMYIWSGVIIVRFAAQLAGLRVSLLVPVCVSIGLARRTCIHVIVFLFQCTCFLHI